MLNICHPGRHGDLLWALPSIRALHVLMPEHDITLHIPPDVAGLGPLLQQQGYISHVRTALDWEVQDSAPRQPVFPPGYSEQGGAISLGYREWPKRPLPYEIADLAARQAGPSVSELAMRTPENFFAPWIEAASTDAGLANKQLPKVLVHWTDRYFELKLGILTELRRNLGDQVRFDWYAAPGSRMHKAGAAACTFEYLAGEMTETRVVLTDCSAAHVLAAGVGVRHVLVVEPESDRHHFIFWPGCVLPAWEQMGTPLGERIRPVLGTDHRPTFDSRHVLESVLAALQEG